MNKKYATKAEINAAAHGRWREILEACGIPSDILDKKHHPCPSCGGTDRFRFTDGSGSSRGSGVWICNQCKPEGGSPFDLLMDVCGYSLNEAKDKVAALVGLTHGPLVDKAPKPLPPPAPPKEYERDLWKPIIPVPEYALKSMTFNNGYRQSDDLIFKSVFRDGGGAILGGVARFKKSDGGKIDMPYTFCENTKTGEKMWRWRCWENPRPLYGLDALSSRPTSPVLVVEGEKCKNAADAQDYGYAVLTWHGGCNNWDKSDWSAVVDRDVVLWPDCDSLRQKLTKKERDEGVDPESKPFLPRNEQGGLKAMMGIADVLTKQNCRVWLVNIPEPGRWPHGFDIADAIADGGRIVDPSEVLSRAGAADWLVEYVPEEERSSENMKSDVPPFPAPYPDDIPPNFETPEAYDDGGSGEWDGLTWALENLAKIDGCESFFHVGLSAKWGKREVKSRIGDKAYLQFLVHPAAMDWPAAKVALAVERKKAVVLMEDDIFKEDLNKFVQIYGESKLIDLKLMGYRGDDGVMEASALIKSIGKDRAEIWLENDSPRKLKVRRPDYGFFPFEPFGVSRREDGQIDCDDEGFVKMVNTYKGLPFEPTKDIDFVELRKKPLFDLVKFFDGCSAITECLWSLCNQDIKVFEWVVNWLACRVRNPTSKQATALVVASPIQGAGKSLIFDKLMNRIFGKYGKSLNQTAMESNFTGDYDEKFYICYEEVSSQKARFDLSGRIKDQITSEYIRIERKGQDAIYQQNFIGFVYLSNYRSPVVVEEHDRRFFVVGPEKPIGKELGGRVAAEIADDKAVQDFVDFLYSLPLTYQDESGNVCHFGSHTPTFDTPAKSRMKEWNSSTGDVFMKDWIEGNLGLPVVHCRFSELYEVFSRWAGAGNEKRMSKSVFRRFLAGYDEFDVLRTNDLAGDKVEFVIVPESVFYGAGERVNVSDGDKKSKIYTLWANAFRSKALTNEMI